MGGGGGWEVRGRLYPLLGLFGVAMSRTISSHRPDTPKESKRCLRGQFWTHASNLSMGPIVSVVTLQGWKKSL